MTKEEKKLRIEELKLKAVELKKEADYYHSLEQSLKLVLNGSYGAFAAPYFILYNEHVAGSITAMGRDLIKNMDKVNQHYWKNLWHDDFELHNKLSIKNVLKMPDNIQCSIYIDTDSLFVSFDAALKHCTYKNLIFNTKTLSVLKKKFIVFKKNNIPTFENDNLIGITDDYDQLIELLKNNDYDYVLVDGNYVKDRKFNTILEEYNLSDKIRWNWSEDLDFIQGIDHYRFADYFKKCLKEYADSFGVENKQDFELEKISESIINIAKKKYIQHIVYEDGIPHDRLTYIFPKGVELVRSSTPLFAREKIVNIVKYLFEHPDTFNIKDLIKLVKSLRKEFELAEIDEISMQSSCSKYEDKIIDDKNVPLKFVNGAHFAVKAAAHHNYLLSTDKDFITKYEFIKSGTKIKYYYCKDKSVNDIFAYIRGSFPAEFAPEVDYDTQFAKCILSPINSIIKPLGLPEITDRLTVVMDIFGGF